jgi:RNA polymerase sigma-70 factor (ECF subfamily)
MAGAPIGKDELDFERGLVTAFGFIPGLFRAQSDVPRAIVAETQLLAAVVLSEGRLTKRQKEGLLYTVAGVRKNKYCLALYAQACPRADDESRALLDFALRLACHGLWFSAKDIEPLTRAGFGDQAILEAVATTALGQMLCILAEALQPASDPQRPQASVFELARPTQPNEWAQPAGPYLKSQPPAPSNFAPFSALRDQLGFIPNLYRAQMLCPDLVAAEAHFLEQILFSEDLLSRVQKENILLAVSASNLNTYGVTLQRQILDGLGVAVEVSDEIVNNFLPRSFLPADKALLDQVRKLNDPRLADEVRFQAEALEDHGFTKPQIVEAVVVAAFANFLNTLQFGLGTALDFPPGRIFTPKDLYPRALEVRPTSDTVGFSDPDAELVRRVQDGNVDVFEELVRRHSRKVFGTLAGLLGNLDDARDGTQDVFLKAFESIGRFEGRARFSTWLISIAINTGTEMLRQRKRSEPLEAADDDEDFRPRQIQQWAEDPEQIFSAAQRNELVRDKILRLPEKYRVALILRDINQLSTEEAAAALELSVPALKARVLRGRLMLRERLAPHFARDRERDGA